MIFHMKVFAMIKKIGAAATAVTLFLSAYFLSGWLGGAFVRWMERGQPQLLFQYATDGQFCCNVYFTEETNARYGVPGDISDLAQEGDLLSLAAQIIKNKWEIAKVLEEKQAYLDYLQQQGTSLTGFFSFAEKLAQMRDNLVFACRYVLFLLWVLVVYIMVRCRPALYFAMGLLCILTTSIKLSGKLAAVFLFDIHVSHVVTDGLLPPLLEAMLTFLIFDITVAAWEKVRLSHKIEALYQDLPALQYLMVHLTQTPDSGDEYRSDFSRLLPHFSDYVQTGNRKRKKALRLIQAIESLSGPHTNRSFLEAAVELQTLLPGK
jgi:hypothetical protein